MLQKSLENPLFKSVPICSPEFRFKGSSNVVLAVRSEAVTAKPANVGMGPHTGRDPKVKKPDWLRQRAPQGDKFEKLQAMLKELKLNTVCVEAQCPNLERVVNLRYWLNV